MEFDLGHSVYHTNTICGPIVGRKSVIIACTGASRKATVWTQVHHNSIDKHRNGQMPQWRTLRATCFLKHHHSRSELVQMGGQFSLDSDRHHAVLYTQRLRSGLLVRQPPGRYWRQYSRGSLYNILGSTHGNVWNDPDNAPTDRIV